MARGPSGSSRHFTPRVERQTKRIPQTDCQPAAACQPGVGRGCGGSAARRNVRIASQTATHRFGGTAIEPLKRCLAGGACGPLPLMERLANLY